MWDFWMTNLRLYSFQILGFECGQCPSMQKEIFRFSSMFFVFFWKYQGLNLDLIIKYSLVTIHQDVLSFFFYQQTTCNKMGYLQRTNVQPNVDFLSLIALQWEVKIVGDLSHADGHVPFIKNPQFQIHRDDSHLSICCECRL